MKADKETDLEARIVAHTIRVQADLARLDAESAPVNSAARAEAGRCPLCGAPKRYSQCRKMCLSCRKSLAASARVERLRCRSCAAPRKSGRPGQTCRDCFLGAWKAVGS